MNVKCKNSNNSNRNSDNNCNSNNSEHWLFCQENKLKPIDMLINNQCNELINLRKKYQISEKAKKDKKGRKHQKKKKEKDNFEKELFGLSINDKIRFRIEKKMNDVLLQLGKEFNYLIEMNCWLIGKVLKIDKDNFDNDATFEVQVLLDDSRLIMI